MPAWARDKHLWERAKNKALASHSESDDAFYAIVTEIYKRMGGVIGASGRTSADVIRAAEVMDDVEETADTTTVSEFSHPDSVRCRASFGSDVRASDKPWRQGEEVTFVYLPEGKHAITAGFRNGSIRLNVIVDASTVETVQESLETLRADRPKQRPYGCVEHREQEASVIAKRFDYQEGAGVVLTAEPTKLGADNVNGKIHWSWSPSFTTDAEYDKCKCSCGDKDCGCTSPILLFPDGARGSASNPARVTGVDFVLGTLTNRPAFREMPPVKGSESIHEETMNDTIKSAWSDKARTAALIARNSHAHSNDAFMASEKANNASSDEHNHEAIAKFHDAAAKLHHESASKHAAAGNDKEAAGHGLIAQGHTEMAEMHRTAAKHPSAKSADAGADDSVRAAGTSEGVRKSWELRKRALGKFQAGGHNMLSLEDAGHIRDAIAEHGETTTFPLYRAKGENKTSPHGFHSWSKKKGTAMNFSKSGEIETLPAGAKALNVEKHTGMFGSEEEYLVDHAPVEHMMRKADKASRAANDSGDPADHKHAAELHKRIAGHLRDGYGQENYERLEHHNKMADRHAAHAEKSWNEQRKKKSPFAHMQALTNAGISPEQYAKERHAPTRKEIEDAAEFYHKSGDLKEEHYGGGAAHATDKPELNRVLAKLAESTTATNNVLQKLSDERPSAEEICARIGRGRSDR